MADGGLQKNENYKFFSTSGSTQGEENCQERSLQIQQWQITHSPACWAEDCGLSVAAIRTTKEFNQGSDMSDV